MTYTHFRRTAVILGTVAMLGPAACQGRDTHTGGRDSARASGDARSDTAAGGMRGMEGMPGMSGMGGMEGGGMMARMQAHMQSMQGVAGGDSLQRMLPMHRQMTANMLSEMNREMRGMNMSGDAAWTALMDSVRQDLRNLPEMNPGQLRGIMPAHHQRVMRLMGMHREMMNDMSR